MIGTFLIKLTPQGVSVDFSSPALIFLVIEMISGFIAYEILKEK